MIDNQLRKNVLNISHGVLSSRSLVKNSRNNFGQIYKSWDKIAKMTTRGNIKYAEIHIKGQEEIFQFAFTTS